MPGIVDIPLTFETKDARTLKRDLERLSSSLEKYIREAPQVFAPRFTVMPVVSGGDSVTATASFGKLLRVGPLDATTVNIALPRPNPVYAGMTIPIVRTTVTGYVFLRPSGGLVNGRARVMLVGDIGLTMVVFDGENYYTDKDAAAWNEGLQ